MRTKKYICTIKSIFKSIKRRSVKICPKKKLARPCFIFNTTLTTLSFQLPMIYIKDESPRFTTFPNTEKKIENTTGSGTFLTNFDVFGHVV